MAKEYAKGFYKSKAWHDCRIAYAKSVQGLCERCRAKGIITPGEIVHHKIYLTPEKIKDPTIALSFDNLELLCRECHNKEHFSDAPPRRYRVDSAGRVQAVGD